MMNSMVENLQIRIQYRLNRMSYDYIDKLIESTHITFDDWCLMHKMRRKAFFHGIINLAEFQLMNSWLGIDHTSVNERFLTLRILIIGTFQHIAMRLYEEKIVVN